MAFLFSEQSRPGQTCVNVFGSQAAKNHIYAPLMFIDGDETKENAASFSHCIIDTKIQIFSL